MMSRNGRYNVHYVGIFLMVAAAFVAVMDYYSVEQRSEEPDTKFVEERPEAIENAQPQIYVKQDESLIVKRQQRYTDPDTPGIPMVVDPDPLIHTKLIVYNSVPKSGSTTMRSLIDAMAIKHGFRYLFGFHDIERKRYLTPIEEDTQARMILNIGAPAIYNKELYYINFTRYGLYQPTYINTIRDPASRKISRFYHDRSESKHWKLKKNTDGADPVKTAFSNMTLESCIESGDIECTFTEHVMVSPNPGPPDYVTEFKVEGILPYFCGQHYNCRFPYSLWSLQRAKESVERNYAIVGTLENWDEWLQVLDFKLPQFFGGIYDLYKSKGVIANQADNKGLVSNATYDLLKEKLKVEYDFYGYVQQRLMRQVAELQAFKAQQEQ